MNARLIPVSLLLAIGSGAAPPAKQPYTTWSDYAGGADSLQYSALKLINKSNVGKLELAFFYPAPGPSGRFAFNPLIVDGVMYVAGKDGAIFAIDAATGKERWSHAVEGNVTNRGFNYWESKDRSDQRLIFAANSYLQEINIKTGVTINTFGNDGRVNLRDGLGRDPKMVGQVQSGSPGHVWENSIILGSAPGEGYGSPPGDLRAYDVITGKTLWTFHTIPRPGEFGYDTWPKDAWKTAGGANAWGEIAIDEKRGIGYFPLGSPTFDLYGADRKGANLFGDCVLALDLRTGKRLWHYQLVHHDMWDYDPTTGPKLLTVKHNGKSVDIVAQATKFGLLYVFDRVTGEPIWPIEERAVPKSEVPGEESWPTQPFPTKPPPFARLKFSPDEINPHLEPAERERLRDFVKNALNEGVFTPQSTTRDQISMPGELGGANWGGAAADPATGMLYVRSADQPAFHKLVEQRGVRPPQGGTPEQQGRYVFSQLCETCHGADRGGITFPKTLSLDAFRNVVRGGKGQMPAFADNALTDENFDTLSAYLRNPEAGVIAGRGRGGPPPPPLPPGEVRYTGRLGAMLFANNGLTAISPPWAQITAYDLNQGTIKWQAPLGVVPALAEKGIRNTGNNYRVHRNGLVATAGGLIFIAHFSDRTVRAYDKDNGKILWEKELETNFAGIPAVYEVAGRQYVAFFGGEGEAPPPTSIAFKAAKPGTQGYYVFALPRK